MKLLFATIILTFAASSFANEATPGPCKEIHQACEKAGFVKGEAKNGTGLWADCINPIMQGKPQPANAKKPLPMVSADLIKACKEKHPKFGQGNHNKK